MSGGLRSPCFPFTLISTDSEHQKNQTRGSCDVLYQLLNTDSSSQDIKLRFFVQSIIIVARYIYYLMIRPGIVSVLFCSVMSSFGTDWQLELGGHCVFS